MRVLFFILSLLLATIEFAFAQGAVNYYPLHVNDKWIQHIDSLNGEYHPATFTQQIEGTDLILGKEYDRAHHDANRKNIYDYIPYLSMNTYRPVGRIKTFTPEGDYYKYSPENKNKGVLFKIRQSLGGKDIQGKVIPEHIGYIKA